MRIVGTVLLGVLGLVPRASGSSSDLERYVREEVSRFHGTMGVVARNLDSGERIAVNEGTEARSGSNGHSKSAVPVSTGDIT